MLVDSAGSPPIHQNRQAVVVAPENAVVERRTLERTHLDVPVDVLVPIREQDGGDCLLLLPNN